jgi:parvulin-like peptidyl-prolyl isomerase
MNRVVLAFSIAVAIFGGIFCAELTARSIPFRHKLADVFGRGHLLAVVHGCGIYDVDVDRALRESDYLSDIDRSEAAPVEHQAALTKLISKIAAQSHATREPVGRANVSREFDVLRFQFRDAETWGAALRGSSLSRFALWQIVKSDLRARQWISNRIASEIRIGDDECRKVYQDHSERFFEPERLRVSQLFLAAPPETAPEIVETKRKAIEALSVRLMSGEDFGALVAENSEDEATKLNVGDLGYFSETRMPSDFVAVAIKLGQGEISRPIQTRLGFHILKLTEVAPSRQRSFDEARGDIAAELANQKRAETVKKLVVDLGSEAGYLRSP